MHVLSGAQFEDCRDGDFEHYFVKTILLWNISDTKKRLFLCESLSGATITGQYLTRQKEFKPRSFLLNTWWKYLDVLPPYGKTFNLGGCAASWYPNMSKNLKKSFPCVAENTLNFLNFYGAPKAEEITVQNILASAFGRFYSPVPVPTLREALELDRTAVATEGDFILDFATKSVRHKNLHIGKIDTNRNLIMFTPLAKEMVVDIGQVKADRVAVQ